MIAADKAKSYKVKCEECGFVTFTNPEHQANRDGLKKGDRIRNSTPEHDYRTDNEGNRIKVPDEFIHTRHGRRYPSTTCSGFFRVVSTVRKK